MIFRILVDCQPILLTTNTLPTAWQQRTGNDTPAKSLAPGIYIVILVLIAIIAIIGTIIAFVVIIVKKRPKVIEKNSIYEGYDTTIVSVGSSETSGKFNLNN